MLFNVPITSTLGVTCDAPPVKPAPVGADHENKVPAGTTPLVTSVGVTVNSTPVQVVVLIGVIIPIGLTVTVNVNGVPGPQATVLGVMI